jgi:hypothetical protein
LSAPSQTIAAWEAWSKSAKSLAPQQQPVATAPVAAAKSVNANLCNASSRDAAERTRSSATTSELIKYFEGLNKGSYAFNWTISGLDAAKQLGFGRRFAATYGQAVEEVQARLASKSRVHIDEIIEYFSQIVREEQTIDRLVGDKNRHFPAVLYLRALQEGECSFPYVLRDTPNAQAMLNHLAVAYPEIKERPLSEPFARIYEATIAYGRKQIEQKGSVSIYRLIEEMRRAIVQSAASPEPVALQAPPTAALPKTTDRSHPGTQQNGLFTWKGNTEASRGYPADFSLSVRSMNECHQRCLQAPTCKIFTYNKKTGICYRYSRADLTHNADFDSGVRN